ncbi:hypothetical protein GOBAR_AA21254 [Gossypium barbadense]|uniref:Uncharacterized protein n=1 Tax=Gossypium barbadense TaxID=3634 RepID=A0A2P5X7V3_GOSBA|nr:hypothetical protein GOBAR_AA21254 [Gossypium barbadense]
MGFTHWRQALPDWRIGHILQSEVHSAHGRSTVDTESAPVGRRAMPIKLHSASSEKQYQQRVSYVSAAVRQISSERASSHALS